MGSARESPSFVFEEKESGNPTMTRGFSDSVKKKLRITVQKKGRDSGTNRRRRQREIWLSVQRSEKERTK